MTFIQNFNAYQTILRKEMVRMFRIWSQTIFPPLITTSMYFIIFGKLLGERLNFVPGLSYLQFILPGMVMTGIINNAFSATSSLMYSMKFQKNIEELLITPTSGHTILLGFMSSGLIRAGFIALLITLVGSLFVNVSIAHWEVLFWISVLAASILSLLGIINGMIAESFDDVVWIPTFILTPLTYLGGVFYPLNILPPIWQKISFLNPLFYLIEAFRYSMLNVSSIDIHLTLSLVTGLALSLYTVAYYLLTRGSGLRP